MEKISDFLVTNWQFISAALTFLLLIIGMVIKKKPVTEIIDDSAYKDLIILVNQAEEKYGAGHGAEKLDFVISSFANLKNLDRDTWIYSSIKSKVETILSTPAKRKETK